MANNPTYRYGEGYNKEASCFIDASSLGDEFESMNEPNESQEPSTFVISSTSAEAPIKASDINNKEKYSVADSLETSEKVSPRPWEESFPKSRYLSISTNTSDNYLPNPWNESLPESRLVSTSTNNSDNYSPNILNESFPKSRCVSLSTDNSDKCSPNPCSESFSKSWFVSFTNNDSMENIPREDKQNVSSSERSRKKGIFDMFVDLHPKDESKGNSSKGTPNQRHFYKRQPKHAPDSKYALGSSSSSDRESGFTENTDSSPSESIVVTQTSLVKLSDLDNDPATLLSPIIEIVDETKTLSLPKQKTLRQSYVPLYLENVKSLTRLFPNLWSVPEIEQLSFSEYDEISTSWSICHSRLSEDLLRLFEKEIATDLTVEFCGRRLRAHKCVLTGRCQYFAGLMSSGLVESAGNILHIDGFSYNTVYFALRYIYSGISELPDSMDMVELTSLADMLCLEGLKNLIAVTIMEKYCHNFHKPCGLCTLGVLDCLALSMQYDLHDVYHRSLNWLTEHFIEIWSTKAFGSMPPETLERICNKQKMNMTPETVVNLVYGCRQIGLSLPNKRWAETVRKISASLLRSAENYSASHLSEVLYSLMKAPSASIHLTESVIVDWIDKAISKAPIKELCKGYQILSDYCLGIQPSVCSLGELRVVEQWRRQCESTLVMMPAHLTLSPGFKSLPQELKTRLKERGCMLDSFFRIAPSQADRMSRTVPPFIPTMSQRKELSQMYKTFVPYTFKPTLSAETVQADVIRKTQEMRPVGHQKTDVLTSNKQNACQNQPAIRMTRAQIIRQQFNKESFKSKSGSSRRPAASTATSKERSKHKQQEAKIKSTSTTSLPSTSGANDKSCNTKAVTSRKPPMTTSNVEQKTIQKPVKSSSASALPNTAGYEVLAPCRSAVNTLAPIADTRQNQQDARAKSFSAASLSTASATNEIFKSKVVPHRRPAPAVTVPAVKEKPQQKQQYPKVKSFSAASLPSTGGNNALHTAQKGMCCSNEPGFRSREINGTSKTVNVPYSSSGPLTIVIDAAISFANAHLNQLSQDSKLKSTSATSIPGGSFICESKPKFTGKSKIPVYTGARKKGTSSMISLCDSSLARAAKVANAAASGKRLPSKTERSPRLASHMLPTASSTAKIVSKKSPTNQSVGSQTPSESPHSPLPRSSTFVKEAPCFPGSPDISQS